MLPFPDVGVPKNDAYFHFWLTVAWCAAVWGLAVLIVLGLIWWTLHQDAKTYTRRGIRDTSTAVVPQGQARAQRGPVRTTPRRDHEPPTR